jgi:hypothetical protein
MFPNFITMSNRNYWKPLELAYLYFYLSHGITHEGIAKLLAVKAPGLPVRSHDGIRGKAKELRRAFDLDNELGKPDPKKLKLRLKVHLDTNLDLREYDVFDLDSERDLSPEEKDILVSLLFQTPSSFSANMVLGEHQLIGSSTHNLWAFPRAVEISFWKNRIVFVSFFQDSCFEIEILPVSPTY